MWEKAFIEQEKALRREYQAQLKELEETKKDLEERLIQKERESEEERLGWEQKLLTAEEKDKKLLEEISQKESTLKAQTQDKEEEIATLKNILEKEIDDMDKRIKEETRMDVSPERPAAAPRGKIQEDEWLEKLEAKRIELAQLKSSADNALAEIAREIEQKTKQVSMIAEQIKIVTGLGDTAKIGVLEQEKNVLTGALEELKNRDLKERDIWAERLSNRESDIQDIERRISQMMRGK